MDSWETTNIAVWTMNIPILEVLPQDHTWSLYFPISGSAPGPHLITMDFFRTVSLVWVILYSMDALARDKVHVKKSINQSTLSWLGVPNCLRGGLMVGSAPLHPPGNIVFTSVFMATKNWNLGAANELRLSFPQSFSFICLHLLISSGDLKNIEIPHNFVIIKLLSICKENGIEENYHRMMCFTTR